MLHSQILQASLAAATIAAGGYEAGEEADALYRYARQRSFPPPETLARKHAEMIGGRFPWSSIAEAPREIEHFLTAFSAVAKALEPFYEPDPEGTDEEVVDPAVNGPDAAAGGSGAGAPATETAGETEPAEAVTDAVPETEPVAGPAGGDDLAPGRHAQGSDAGTADAGASVGPNDANDAKAKKNSKK